MINLENKIKAEAIRLGFSFCGIAEPRQTPHFENFREWIQKGQNAGMEYLAKDYVINGRRQPSSLLENAKSVIVAGIHYRPQITIKEIRNQRNNGFGWIASYGCLSDYHQTLKEMFKKLIGSMKEMTGSEFKNKIFIDSGPVMEKDFAVLAGLGWIGRNSLLITSEFGSYCLLGCLFTDIDLLPAQPLEGDICSDCRMCIQACPTGCINENRTINAGVCISYQTIENQNEFPVELEKKINGWIFGCDICQLVCPINQRIISERERKSTDLLIPRFSQKININLASEIDPSEFQKIFSNTPLSRIDFNCFHRNVTNAIENQQTK
jgi:epoxyqueuosine reductase